MTNSKVARKKISRLRAQLESYLPKLIMSNCSTLPSNREALHLLAFRLLDKETPFSIIHFVSVCVGVSVTLMATA